jgi:hypothetical protein
MFSFSTSEEDGMIYAQSRRPGQFFANVGGALLVGLFFAVVGLNAASGCGESNGQCIGVKDFVGRNQQIASR